MNIFLPHVAVVLIIAGSLWAGCASSALPRVPQRIDRVPAGQYHVKVSESPTGGQKYNAVLFELETASVILDVPTVEEKTAANLGDYQSGMRPGFVVYEIRDVAGVVRGYLLVPPQARVTVWDRPGQRGVVSVTVSDAGSAPEMGGSGAGGGGGM